MRFLFIDIDTLRPDHLGCYGYSRNTSPNIDAVCREGIRFDRYYCSDAPCLPSRAALVSGQFGIRNGAVGHGGTAADRRSTGYTRDFSDILDRQNLHFIFRRAGMYTVSVSTFAERHSSYWFDAGFNECYNVGGCGGESGEQVIPVALDWLKRNRDRKDWFLHLHLWDPHTPYRAPVSFQNPFENEPLDTWITEDILESHKKLVCPHGINEINMYDDRVNPAFWRMPGSAKDMKGLRRILDGYDGAILYTDMLLKQVFDLLKEQGVYDETAIVITSDHGENMGEFGIYSEHATADECTCHIPFILKWPDGPVGKVDSDFHYHLDLLPTLSELLHVEPCANWDGESYAPVITESRSAGRDHVILSQMAHVCQRSARFGDWLYIRTYDDGFHLAFDREMLFNIRKDPHEQRDVKDEHPDLCAFGAKLIFDWQDEQMLKNPSLGDPLWTVLSEGGPFHTRGYAKPYADWLEQTGRSEGAAILRQRYPD